MGQQPHRGGHCRSWLFGATIALSASVPLVAASPGPVLAQEEISPTEALQIGINACIASGTEGSECAAAATLALQAIMSGDADPAGAAPAPEGGTAGNQVNGSAGADGQISNGRDQAVSADPPAESAPEGETAAPPAETAPAPAETTPVPLVESMAPPPVTETTTPPVETAPPAGGITTTSTSTDTGTTNESTSTITGGAQTNDASGIDGGQHSVRD